MHLDDFRAFYGEKKLDDAVRYAKDLLRSAGKKAQRRKKDAPIIRLEVSYVLRTFCFLQHLFFTLTATL